MEVAAFQEADQFPANKSEYMCGFFAVMMALSMAPSGHRPLLTREQVVSRAEAAYGQYNGDTSSSNMDGMSLTQEYQLLQQVGLHYQAIAMNAPTCTGWLRVGYPICVAIMEASVQDAVLDRNPYPWAAAGSHVILLTGVEGGLFLVRDSANCTDLFDPASLRPGPRKYRMSTLQFVSATVVVPPWMPQPTSAIPPDQGGPAMIDTTNQMIVDLWNSQIPYFKALGLPLPARDTGIFYNAYHVEYPAGRFRGVPQSPEYSTVDSRGVAVIAQNFSGGICHYYPKTGMVIWM